MNNDAVKLINQLAQKLGTTSEYLWGVLLKQAPIDATVTLIQITLVGLFGFILYKTHGRLMKKTGDESLYEKYELMAIIPMILAAFVFAVLAIVSFVCIGDVVNGYLNPEYWALNRVLLILKQ